jgi:hypothetical protein
MENILRILSAYIHRLGILWKVLWHVNPLLNNDREISNYTTVSNGSANNGHR